MVSGDVVADITTTNPVNNETFTLDGLGMNFLVGSILSSDPFTLGQIRAGAFDFLVFDKPSDLLGLRFNSDVLPVRGI